MRNNVLDIIQMADIQTSQTLQSPVPKIFQGKPIVISVPATPELKAFVASLVKRADRLRNGRVDPSEDNMLKITGDGRKAALDLRLVQKGVTTRRAKSTIQRGKFSRFGSKRRINDWLR